MPATPIASDLPTRCTLLVTGSATFSVCSLDQATLTVTSSVLPAATVALLQARLRAVVAALPAEPNAAGLNRILRGLFTLKRLQPLASVSYVTGAHVIFQLAHSLDASFRSPATLGRGVTYLFDGGSGLYAHNIDTDDLPDSDDWAPPIPTSVAGVAGDGSVALSWVLARDTNVTGYVINVYAAGVLVSALAVNADDKVETVTGLTNGVAYTFEVAASWGGTIGGYSAMSAEVTPEAAAWAFYSDARISGSLDQIVALSAGALMLAGGGASPGAYKYASAATAAAGTWGLSTGATSCKLKGVDRAVIVDQSGSTPFASYWENDTFSARSFQPAADPIVPTGVLALTGTTALMVGGNRYSSPYGGYVKTWMYSTTDESWTQKASLNTARGSCALVELQDGRILAVGGEAYLGDGQGGTPLASVERCDAALSVWTTVAPLPIALRGPTACVLSDGRVFVTGGYNASGAVDVSKCNRRAWVYNPTTDAWAEVTQMPLVSPSNAWAATRSDGKVLVMAGDRNTTNPRSEYLYTYDAGTDAWAQVGDAVNSKATPDRYPNAAHMTALAGDGMTIIRVRDTGSGTAVEPNGQIGVLTTT